MKLFFVLLACFLHVTKSQIFPVNQEFEYNYEALVQVVTQYPVLHTSEFLINAKLNIIGINNGAFVIFKDVTHTVYSGKGDKIYTDSNKIGLDQESQFLMTPFVITYDPSGRVENIFTDKSDMLWSINIKKAIASLLQLDVRRVVDGGSKGFYSEEQTVHGNCKVQYAITPGFGGTMKIFKHHNAYACEEFKLNRIVDLFSPQCDKRRGEILTISNERFYDVKFVRNGLDINHMESFNSIIFNPFFNNDQNIFVNQTLHKLSERELSEELNIDRIVSDKILHRLKNEIADYDLEEVYDISGGRQIVNQDIIMQNVKESLRNILNYIRKNNIILTENIIEQKQSMSFLFHQIKMMNLDTLYNFYKTIFEEKGDDVEEMQELFLQALPFAGSYHSTMFIRNLIMENKVKDKTAVKMLQDVPFYIKNLNKEILRNFFELIKENNLSKEVVKTSMLAFASMVNLGAQRYGENDDDIERYVFFYLNGLEQSKDIESQTMFMHALKNVETDKVVNYMINILKGRTPGIYFTSYSKVLAMWVVRKTLIQYPGKVSTMFWPMLIDRREDFEVRASALQILLLSATMSGHMKLYWFMQSINDFDLYNYYYTMLTEFTRTTGSCYNINAQRARNMLRFVKKPKNPAISQALKLVQLADIVDAHYGYGLFNQVVVMGNLATKAFVCMNVQQSPNVEDMQSVKQSMLIRIKVSENLQKLFQNQQSDIDINQFMASLKPYDLELEISKIKYGRIVSVVNYNAETLNMAYQKLKERRDNKGILNFYMDQFVGEEIFIPTDLGVPVSLFFQMPAVRMTKINFDPTQVDKGTMKWKFTYDNAWWYQHKTGLAVYNPIANLWHGSRRFLSLDVHLPMDIETTFGLENSIKMSLNKDGGQRLGFHSHVHNHVFMFSDDHEVKVDKMCSECRPITIVSQKDNIHNQDVISENKAGDIQYEYSLFDCERNMSLSGMSYLKERFTKNNLKTSILSAMKYWRVYDRISEGYGMCGIGLWYETHNKDSDTKNVDMNRDLKKDEFYCEIGKDYVIDTHNVRASNKINSDWKIYASECDQTCKWSLSVKKVEGDKILGVQLKYLNNVVEIYPQQGYQVWLDGKMLQHLTTGYFDGSWFNYKVLGQENMLILRVKNFAIRIQHDGNSVKLSLPEKPKNLHKGYCYGVSKLSVKA